MIIVPTSRAVLHDATHGSVTVDHDPQSGAVFIEFERLESDDLILPNYRVALSTEHVLAWIESLLARIGRTCRRLDPGAGRRSLNRMLRLTEQERDTVYLSSHGAHVVMVRGGCVLKVPFALEPMAEFLVRLKEEPGDAHDTTASEIAAFVKSMMIPQ